MSSELDNDNSESLHFSTPPEKIDPRDTPLIDERNGESNQGLLDNEEKGDPPKLEDLVSSGSSTTNAGHFYRDVYSSSPDEDIDLEGSRAVAAPMERLRSELCVCAATQGVSAATCPFPNFQRPDGNHSCSAV